MASCRVPSQDVPRSAAEVTDDCKMDGDPGGSGSVRTREASVGAVANCLSTCNWPGASVEQEGSSPFCT